MYLTRLTLDNKESRDANDLTVLAEDNIIKQNLLLFFDQLGRFYIGRKCIECITQQRISQEALREFNEWAGATLSWTETTTDKTFVKTKILYYAFLDSFMGAILSGGQREQLSRAKMEMIPVQELDSFLHSAFSDKKSLLDPTTDSLLLSYHNQAENSVLFDSQRVSYFGSIHTLDAAIIFKKISARARNLREGSWYSIYLKNELEGDDFKISIYDKTSDSFLFGSCSLTLLPNQELFKSLFMLTSTQASSKKVTAISQNSTFDCLRFYAVGQALCVGLMDKGKTLGFFDLGYPDPFNKPCGSDEGKALNTIKKIDELPSEPRLIIISHWHADHINLISKLRQDFLKDCRVIAPVDSRGPCAIRINRIIQASGCTLTLYSDAGDILSLDNLKVKKIFLTTPPPDPSKPFKQKVEHPHHEGIFALVSLSNSSNKKNALLVGDTTYKGIVDLIPSAEPFDCLQVCHHGGDYHLSPHKEKEFVPRLADKCVCVLSYGLKNAYNHPCQQEIDNHKEANRGISLKMKHICNKTTHYLDFNI